MKKIILTFILLIFSFSNGYGIEDKVVAVVNNEAITKAELDSYVRVMKLQMGIDNWIQYQMTDGKALDSLIENRLIIQEAKNKEVKVEDRIVKARIDRMKKRFESESQFYDALNSQGISYAEFQERTKEQLLSEKIVTDNVRNRIFISPKEVTDFYNSHIDQFNEPESIQVDSIFVYDKKLADDIYKQLIEGADFNKLQEEYSQTSSLGLVHRGQLKKEIEDIIFNLDIGKVFKPVEESKGYYIFLVREKFPASKKELSDVQEDIFDLLVEMKFNMKFKAWIEDLKSKAYISINNG